MNNISKYIAVALFIIASIFTGCKKDQDENIDQSDDIVSYLESSHSPILVSESALSSLDEDVVDQPFYTRYGTYAYRYISTYYDAERNQQPQVQSGSTIKLTYSFFEFTGSSNSSTLPLQTNNPSYEQDLIDAGLNMTYQNLTPKSIVIGGDILSSLHDGLVGCRQGDIIELYMTYEMAYGESIIGFISKGSSIEVHCTIEEVN